MSGLLELLGLGLVLAWLLGVAVTSWLITHPPRRTYASAVSRDRPGDPGEIPGFRGSYETWYFRSRGRDLPVWDIPGRHPDGPTLIMTHGWSDGKVGALVRIPDVLDYCSRIIAWDMPGHGEAPGRCDLGVGEVEDLVTLIREIGDAEDVVLFGWSLGGGVSIAAGAELGEKVRCVIAEAPYRLAITPARNVMQTSAMPWRPTLWPAMWVLALLGRRPLNWAGHWERFDRAKLAARLRCPLLVIHGEDDPICPTEDGRQIASASPQGTFVMIPHGTHNGLWTDESVRESTIQAVTSFLSACSGRDRP
ncbi:MAG TPA: alpha/beta hydrolase [Phycisphaerales bacterium]|nr:alpha/beta hydrolase [Phycisphaerales bacterium]